jgi:L-ribulokinase
MQTLANVLNKPIKIAASDQTPALGAAIYAAVAAGIYPNVIEASQKMGSGFDGEFFPQLDKVAAYHKLLLAYEQLSHFADPSIKNLQDELYV